MSQGRDRQRLAADLLALGLPRGRDVLVHCSLRQVGPVAGGPRTLFRAIRSVAGPAATVVVPTQTPNNSTTSTAFREATSGMSEAERSDYERSVAFDPDRTPSYGMGALAEYVRRRDDAVRSAHPLTSFAAVGPAAQTIVADHALHSHLGDESPLATLYDRGAGVLLIGVGFESCTALHLAEYRLPTPVRTRPYRCYSLRGGERVRHEFEAPQLTADDFDRLGAQLQSERPVSRGTVGQAAATLVGVPDAVDFAIGWMAANRRL